MRLMLQAQHAQPARQPDRPRRRLSQRLPAQERHQQRPLKHQKVLPLQSLQKARQPPVPVQRKRQKRMPQHHKICSHFCIHRDHESVRSCHLSPGCVGFKRGGKIIRNERILERRQCSFLGNGGRKFREGRKTSETNADNSAQAAADSQTASANSATAAKNQKPTRKIVRQQQRSAKPTLKRQRTRRKNISTRSGTRQPDDAIRLARCYW